jgi:hypothetical protein
MAYTTQYPPAHSDTYVKATTVYSGSYSPWFATDPALSLIGSWANTEWGAAGGEATNQRLHIDLGSSKIIKRIYYENSHNGSGSVIYGVQNFTLWGSNTEASFLELTYGTDTGWTQITTSQGAFDIHKVENEPDPKFITVTNSVAYRYYAMKIADCHGGSEMMFRRIELQTEDAVDFEYTASGSLTFSGSAVTVMGLSYTGQTGKWSGVGMCFEDVWDEDNYDKYFDGLLAAGFEWIRIGGADATETANVAQTQIAALAAKNKGFKVIFCVNASEHTLTAANWNAHATAVKGYATWAENNSMDEFCFGNEEENHNDKVTLTNAQVRTNIRALATEVQALYTIGDVTYSNAIWGQDESDILANWISEGKGDIDQIGWFCYRDLGDPDFDYWMSTIDDITAEWTPDEAYISEFNLDSGGYEWWADKFPELGDEEGEAIGITELIAYLRSKGISRAFFFYHTDPGWYGADAYECLKEDDTYRLLWWSLLDSAGSSFRYSGTATQSHGYNFNTVGTGSLSFSGSADVEFAIAPYTASGSFDFSGTGLHTLGFAYITSGSFTFSGSAVQEHFKNYLTTGAGSLIFSGEAICYKEIGYTATGSFTFSGIAIQSYTYNHSCVAIGAFAYSGIAICSLGHIYITSGAYNFSGIATYILGITYVGSGDFTFSGSADYSYELEEEEEFIYVGTGLFSYSGIGTYTFTRNYIFIGSGSLIFSGEAIIEISNFIFTGSGIFIYSGEAENHYCYSYVKIYKDVSVYIKVEKDTSNYTKVERGC